MAALPRSEVSFRRSGSSGLVWDDKLLSGELKPIKPKDEEEKIEKGESRSEPRPRPYRTVEVEPTFDPPSPKVSGCVCFGGKKPAKKGQQHPQQKHKKPSSGGGNRKSL